MEINYTNDAFSTLAQLVEFIESNNTKGAGLRWLSKFELFLNSNFKNFKQTKYCNNKTFHSLKTHLKVINIESFNLNDLIENLIQELQGITKPGQKIVLSFSKSGSYLVNLDKKLLRNIIINLVSNAIKFSHESTNITISVNLYKSEIKIGVTDQGIGIPEADQKHLFERFFRSSNAGEIQGTGLGLSIVAHYVNLHRGTITFKSKENKGTTFFINLPRNF